MSDTEKDINGTEIENLKGIDLLPMHGEPKFKVYKRRFYILGVFGGLTFTNAIGWISMSPIASTVKRAYGVSDFQVNMISLIYLIMFLPGMIIANYLFEKYNLRVGILFGATLQAIGMGIKALINQQFWLVLLGQTILGLCQPSILDAPAFLATIWFEDELKEIVYTIGPNANTLGIAIGFLYPTFFVNDDSTDDEKSRDEIALSLMVLAGFSVFLFLVTLFTFQTKPKTPPSSTAVLDHETNVLRTYVKLFTNYQFLLLSATFSIFFTDIMVLSTILDSIVEDYGFNTDDSGFFGFTNVLAGFFGGILYGFLLKWFQSHKLLNVIIGITTTVCLIVFYFALQTEKKYIVTIAYGLCGFASFPCVNVSVAYIVEITLKINEATSVGLSIGLTQMFGFAITNLCSESRNWFKGDKGNFAAIAILVILTVIGTVIAIIMKPVPRERNATMRSMATETYRGSIYTEHSCHSN